MNPFYMYKYMYIYLLYGSVCVLQVFTFIQQTSFFSIAIPVQYRSARMESQNSVHISVDERPRLEYISVNKFMVCGAVIILSVSCSLQSIYQTRETWGDVVAAAAAPVEVKRWQINSGYILPSIPAVSSTVEARASTPPSLPPLVAAATEAPTNSLFLPLFPLSFTPSSLPYSLTPSLPLSFCTPPRLLIEVGSVGVRVKSYVVTGTERRDVGKQMHG